jgi:serine/threonine-protein kinase
MGGTSANDPRTPVSDGPPLRPSGRPSAHPVGVPAMGTIVDGKYELVRVLGIGGMGAVVAARHAKLGQSFALKFLLAEATRQPEALARFAREGRAAAALRSEHVARVTDLGALPTGEPYLVLEYLHGTDLNRLVETEGRLAPERAVDFVLQALEALAEAHANGIIHRDLKPANLFLTTRVDGGPLVKILDFGISKLVADSERITASSTVMGSPHYMSPEQIKSVKNVDARTDVWAVGVILYELVTGKLPFDADSMPGIVAAIVTEPPTPPTAHVPDLPRDLEAVILACLEKDRNKRVRDVAELAERLAPFASAAGRGDVESIRRVAQSGALRAATIASVAGASTPPPAHSTDSSWQRTAARASKKGSLAGVALAAFGVIGLVGIGFTVFALRTVAREAATADGVPTTEALATAASSAPVIAPTSSPASAATSAPSAIASVTAAPAASAAAADKPARSTHGGPAHAKPAPATTAAKRPPRHVDPMAEP